MEFKSIPMLKSIYKGHVKWCRDHDTTPMPYDAWEAAFLEMVSN
jgi:hypothetical protein